MSIAFVNGEFLDLNKPSLKPNDVGILRGYGVYEGITSYQGKVFRLKDHYERLLNSASFLKIKVPVSLSELENILDELIRRNSFERTDFRLVLTGGDTISGIDFDGEKPSLFIIAEDHQDLSKDIYQKGATVITSNFVRENAPYKTLNYIQAVRLQEERKKAKAIEIIYYHDDLVLEASTSNVFVVKNSKIITPKENILAGITRKVVLELCSQNGIEVEERGITMQEFFDADEVFITSSFKEIVPIVKVDDKNISSGLSGPITLSLVKYFGDYTKI